MADIIGNANMPKEDNSDYSCDDITKFLEELLRSVFKARNLESQWTTQLDPEKQTLRLFTEEIGTEVAEYCNRYAEEFRKNDIFNSDNTNVIEDRLKEGYYYDSTCKIAVDLLQKTAEQETVNSTYYCLALIAELCFQLSRTDRENLIPSVIRGVECALHHRTNLQFERRYWFICKHAMTRHNPQELQKLTVDALILLG